MGDKPSKYLGALKQSKSGNHKVKNNKPHHHCGSLGIGFNGGNWKIEG